MRLNLSRLDTAIVIIRSSFYFAHVGSFSVIQDLFVDCPRLVKVDKIFHLFSALVQVEGPVEELEASKSEGEGNAAQLVQVRHRHRHHPVQLVCCVCWRCCHWTPNLGLKRIRVINWSHKITLRFTRDTCSFTSYVYR